MNIRNLLESTNGRTFSVVFRKKDGTMREMNCRTGVTKHLKGGVNPCAGKEDILTVFDMQKGAYRNITLHEVKVAKVDGVVYNF